MWFQGCAGCKCPPSVPPATPFDVEIHEMELCSVLKAQEECAGSAEKNLTETAMDNVQLEDEEDDEEEAQKDSADTTAEKQSATLETVKEKT